MNTFAALALGGTLGFVAIGPWSSGRFASTGTAQTQPTQTKPTQTKKKDNKMQLGVFSVSLAVKDISVSRSFYEKFGFEEVGGDMKQNWIILQNGTTTIGLFQGMFKKNMLTFCPGWNRKKEALKEFQDVRELQRRLKERGIKMQTEADESSTGPASFVVIDPDGNPILVDQHVPKPKK